MGWNHQLVKIWYFTNKDWWLKYKIIYLPPALPWKVKMMVEYGGTLLQNLQSILEKSSFLRYKYVWYVNPENQIIRLRSIIIHRIHVWYISLHFPFKKSTIRDQSLGWLDYTGDYTTQLYAVGSIRSQYKESLLTNQDFNGMSLVSFEHCWNAEMTTWHYI